MGYFKYILVAFLIFSCSNFILGIFEYSILGPYSDEAVWAPFFDVFQSESSEGGVKASMPTFDESDDAEKGSTWDTIAQVVTWNFVVFDSGFGQAFRYYALIPVSAAFLFALVIMFLSIFIPWFRGG